MQERFVIKIDVPINNGFREETKPVEKPVEKSIGKAEEGTAKARFEKAVPKKENYFTGQLKTGAAALGAGAAALAISNVGTLTGSQAAQNQVNNISKMAGLGVLTATNPALGIAAIALTMANNAIQIAKETREWNLAEARNSERIGITASQRGR